MLVPYLALGIDFAQEFLTELLKLACDVDISQLHLQIRGSRLWIASQCIRETDHDRTQGEGKMV